MAKFIQLHRAAVSRDEEAIPTNAAAIDSRDASTGPEVEQRHVPRPSEQIFPASIRMTFEEPVGELLGTGKGVGIHEIEFFASISIDVARNGGDRPSVGIRDFR